MIKKTLLVLVFLVTVFFLGILLKYHLWLSKYIKEGSDGIKTTVDLPVQEISELYILGTVHFQTDNYKRDDLYYFLDSISPSVILYEGDSKHVRRILSKTDIFERFMDGIRNHDKVEKPVVLKYLHYHQNCKLLPYEWELRNEFHLKHNLREKSKYLLNAVLNLSVKDSMSAEIKKMANEFLTLNQQVLEIGNGSIAEINNVGTDSLLQERQKYVYEEVPKLASSSEKLSYLSEFIPIHEDYWETRNNAMVQNILHQIKAHPENRFVVLNGFYHRYFLLNKLKKYEDAYQFKIMDF